ncbi:MAG: response regulator, partial [Acidobacteria bacterium]|nr:response regulator [Acidobacteriota bacterium]
KFSGVSLDITERRQVEEQALEAQKFDSVSRVMGKAAHGFNNLLMIIGGYGDQLLSGLAPADPLRADIEEILRATERVSDISTQLQSFTRRPASQPREFNAAEFLKHMDSALRPMMPKNITLTLDTQADLKIKADPVQLDQVVRSFVNQSVRGLTEGGNLTIQATVVELGEDYASSRSTLRPGPHAAIVIHDDGRGLDPESRRKLFEPAFGQPEGPGRPVSLAAAYGLLRQNGGDVTVESSTGEGCEFRLLFPLITDAERISPARPHAEERPAPKAVEPEPKPAAKMEPLKPPAPREVALAPVPRAVEVKHIETKPVLRAPAPPRPEPPQVRVVVQPAPEPPPPPAPPARPVETVKAPAQEAPVQGARTVLVVEDEAGIRMLMRKILDRQGYNVIEATRGDEALEIVRNRKTPVQLLVTDLVMPHMGGRELAERLTRTHPTVKVLFVSGFTDDEVIRSGSLGPGTAFLQKPFTLGSLVEKVREVLGE